MDRALDALVRRADEDRWLASRFAPPAVRERLIAVYALNYEIARTAETVATEGLGAIRLAWWAEAIDEIYSGKGARAHPALQAYAAALDETPLPRAALDALIVARNKDFETAPFASWAELDAYLDATAGGVLRLALAAAGEVSAPATDDFVEAAGRAWGGVGLARAARFWRARGRAFFPQGHAPGEAVARARAAYDRARVLAKALPSAAFPAVGYLALTPRYIKTLERGAGAPPLFARQLSLIAASATGRL